LCRISRRTSSRALQIGTILFDQFAGELSFNRHSAQPHLQIRHRSPDVPRCPGRNHPGGGNRDSPPPREKGRENRVFRWLEADRLKAGLEAFGETAEVEVRGAEECVAWLHPVEVGEEHVLGVLGAAVQLIHYFDRPRSEERSIGERACPFTGEFESHFLAVHVLDGDGVTGECVGDQVDQTRLADTGSAGH